MHWTLRLRKRSAVGTTAVAAIVLGAAIAQAKPSEHLTTTPDVVGSAGLATGVRQLASLSPPSASPSLWYGRQLATAGNVLAVLAPVTAKTATRRGPIVFVYARRGDTWRDPRLVARLGVGGGDAIEIPTAIAMTRNVIAVGDPAAGNVTTPSAGAVYLFARGRHGWHDEMQTATVGVPGIEYLGNRIALSGNTLAATGWSAPQHTGVTAVLATAAAYHRARLLTQLPGPGVSQQGPTNLTLAMTRGEIAVANPGGGRGSVAVFVPGHKGWRSPLLGAKLATGRRPASQLGAAMAFAGKELVVSAELRRTHAASGLSALLVYARRPARSTRMAPTATLTATGGANDSLGFSLAANAREVVAGDPNWHVPGRGEGAVYIFRKAPRWPSQAAEPVLSSGGRGFGAAVALGQGVLGVGAYQQAGGRGAAKLYSAPAAVPNAMG